MADARNEVARDEGPSAAPLKPVVDARHSLLRDVENRTVFHDHVGVEDAAESIASRDAAGAAEECREERWQEIQCLFKDQVAGKREEPFVGYRKANNSENE